MTLTRIAASVALAAAAMNSHAVTPIGDYLTFSGFGTLGYVRADTDQGQYRREFQQKGADKSGSLLVDSNLGLQLTATANDWLSATVQTLTAERDDDKLSTRFEWAFVKVAPVEGLSVRVGQMNVPNFLVSASRRIGYANTTLRPANEVYGLDLLSGGLRGADVSYRLPVGDNKFTATVLGGRSKAGPTDVDSLRGVNGVWDGNWYTLRLGYVEAKPDLPGELQALLPAGQSLSDAKYQFSGFGFTVDRNDVVMQGEFVKRRYKLFNTLIAADAWYLMAGYRMGAFLPYAQVAQVRPAKDAVTAPQRTLSAGVRWDAFSSAALKFQVERVDTRGTAGASFITAPVLTAIGPLPGPITRPVTTVSASIDFAF
ncbi:porin [Mitsuaria sp. GD03876]|uniref:porin n=1 Tax=Mitsuaria sp. GD03876 TaxID=2975399 RepID=UPI00244854FA|nr:porin [Mitsuaria sp. GD03876]MDH0864395.1 porin [Mitsuaria sp. GD03876]